MVKLIDCTVEEFLKRIAGEKIIVFGAGRNFEQFVSFFHLEKQIICVADNDVTKHGTTLNSNGELINIVSPAYLQKIEKTNCSIVVANTFYVADIVQQLDCISNIENMDCYVYSLMEEKCQKHKIQYTQGMPQIPKLIHYCWFGGKEIPQHLKCYLESWHQLCPDYQIERWDESNYDVMKNKYIQEAYKHGKWGFVSDYARLDIVYQYGGIYIDTDVEIIKSFDDLLNNALFMGFFDTNNVALGLGFGAKAGNPLVRKMRDYYNDKTFVHSDGKLEMKTCLDYQRPVLLEYGFRMDNSFQNINDNVIYPSEVFNPEGRLGYHKCYSSNTHSVHWTQMSCESEEVKRKYTENIKFMKERIGNKSDGRQSID